MSDGQCGRDGEQCLSCRDQGATCDAVQGICKGRERNWRVCVNSAVVDGDVEWDLFESFSPPSFSGLVTLGAPSATQNMTGMPAIEGRAGAKKTWTAVFGGSTCVRGVSEAALAGGSASGVVVSVWEDDLFQDDSAGSCSLRIESMDLLRGSQTMQLTQANGECSGHVGMVTISLTPES